MLGAVRRFGVTQALRASAPRALSIGWASQLLKWQPPTSRSPVLSRALHTTFPALNAAASGVAAEIQTSSESELVTEFEDLKTKGLIDPFIIRNITERMGLKTMTEVQSQTINQMLSGEDVLAQAKTGTGKTLAFLLPTLQNILSDPTLQKKPSSRKFQSHGRNRSFVGSSDIRALIISPTRELAEQIAAEAIKVAQGTGLVVQTAVGGTHKRSGLMRIQRDGCHLLVGTPGRIKDILSDPSSGVSAPKLNTLILDEADRLLDQGFAPEIAQIQDLLPDPFKVDRQTLMLSATVPKEVMTMVKRTMKPGFKFVKTIREDEVPTHLRVPQKAVFLRGYENALPAVLELAKNYQALQAVDETMRPFKAMVYFNSTNEVNLAAEAFWALRSDSADGRSRSPLGRLRVLQIHSRLTQAQRTNSANNFRRASEAILFSSDVTARGMDFPDVTHVIQVGVPRDRETYIHRIGRTGRANKSGEGWVFLHDGEYDFFQQKMGDLPINEDSKSLPAAMENMSRDLQDASPAVAETITQIKDAMNELSPILRETTYRSQLGTLTSSFSSRRTAVQALNSLAINGYCLSEPPTVKASIARNLGIDRVKELRIEDGPRRNLDPLNSVRRGRDFDRRGGSSNRGSSSNRGGFSRFGEGRGSSRNGSLYGARSNY
ncbi:ATP-dependent RNA helicase [Penicillium macrosclerotiorum]|uniref:ATP-dependent RNA helicase n=1 Tax=Penicillium macrosclerotiorum TaxID=303699 RepID=UPI002546A4EC|nr:ATP-dependent RNA helicase [Penicillium macrosclerotiorum]KAJ5682771.1 ATP-dependent RNA helicase [Penicillium macrosclerotiorum]